MLVEIGGGLPILLSVEIWNLFFCCLLDMVERSHRKNIPFLGEQKEYFTVTQFCAAIGVIGARLDGDWVQNALV